MIDFDLYEGKSYNDLLKDIVTNTENKRDQIDIVIGDLRDKIATINDAIVLAPIIQTYLDISIKNDDELVKLASIVQRLITAKGSGDGSGDMGLSDLEKEQLMKDIREVQAEAKAATPVVEVKKTEKK